MDKVLRKLATGWDVGDNALTRAVREDGFERFAHLVDSVEGWASAMVKERSRLVIHPGHDWHSRSGVRELRPLFETGDVLAVTCLLHEAGIVSGAGRAMCEARRAITQRRVPSRCVVGCRRAVARFPGFDPRQSLLVVLWRLASCPTIPRRLKLILQLTIGGGPPRLRSGKSPDPETPNGDGPLQGASDIAKLLAPSPLILDQTGNRDA